MNKRFLLTIGLAVGLTALAWGLLALSARPGQAAVVTSCDRYVAYGGDNASDNDCRSPNRPCKTVQYALDRASTGETICVANRDDIPGPTTYYGPIVIANKSVTLDGAWQAHPNELGPGWTFSPAACNPENVVLSGNTTGRVISIQNANPTIYCTTITEGNAGGAAADLNKGGGIAAWNAAPTIVGNIITGNYGCTACATGRGGGIYLADAPATAVISGNLIANNTANGANVGWGGGIYLENASAQVISNTVQGNRGGGSAGNGGGIAVNGGSPTIADNAVRTNTAGGGMFAHGGGIFIDSDTVVTVERNLIDGNAALRGAASAGAFSRGGGLFYDGPLAVIRDNRIYGNVATFAERGLGGGMYLHGLSAAAEVTGNAVGDDNRASYLADGKGGGIYLDASDALVADNQVYGNTASSSPPAYGGGLYVNGGGGLIRGNRITGNRAVVLAVGEWAYGGGIALLDSRGLVQDNFIASNTAAAGDRSRGVGGGVYVWGGAPRFFGNEVLGNTTGGEAIGYGGGFDLGDAEPWLEGNTILGNQAPGAADGGGGGVSIGPCPAFTLTNNIIAGNTVGSVGSGVAIAGGGLHAGRMAHNTIVANLGGDGVGVHVSGLSDVALINNIIASQTVGIVNATPGSSAVSATHTLFEGNGSNYSAGVSSTNEVAGPARLLSDYHLGPGSNAIDRALPLDWVTRDIDGDPRPMGPAPDVGADEKAFTCYLPLVRKDHP